MNNRPTTIFSAAAVTAAAAADLVAILEWTADTVWVSKTQECRRATLRGVPAKRVDVIVDRRITDNTMDQRDVLVLTVVAKPGRFDGAIRPRIHLGVSDGRHDRSNPAPPATLDLAVTAERIDIRIGVGGDGWGGACWSGSFARLRSDLDCYHPARVVMWHWRRYYPHIPEADAVAAADAWAAEMEERPAPPSLAEANREASRVLYRLSRDLGWAKLTLRDHERTGLGPGWVRSEDYAARLADYHGRRRPDISDATLAFAAGVPGAAARFLSSATD